MRCLALLVLLLAPAFAGIDDFADQLQPIRAIPPTPQGDSHLGNLPSGQWVQIRLPLTNQPPLAYGVNLNNVVGFTGRGTSYQLIVRRDGPEGKVLHEGPLIPSGDAWNADNTRPIDLLDSLTPDDYRKGYLDLFITGKIENDGFTLYRDNDGRPITATMAPATPEVRAALEQAKQAKERGLALIPPPQRLTLQPGDLKLTDSSRIVLPKDDPDDRFAATDLAAAIAENCGRKLSIAVGQARPADIVLAHTNATLEGGPEAYRVTVTDQGVRAEARSAEGLFYAACTVGQLVTRGGTLPHCRIEDWPAFPLRGLQYDVARGQTVNVDWWKRVIRILARCKLNAIMVYGEDDYGFAKYPFLGRPGTFTPAKAKELSEYAWRYHLQLIPQFESLGHAAAVLGHEELKGLREAGGAWVFCTSKPETWQFLDDVIGELAEQFPHSQYLHIGADEFEGGFGLCPECKAKVDKVGYVGLYVEHMNHLQQLCAKHNRTMLFWPSHGGPSDELSYLSIKGAAQLDHAMIPTEWIYHGPAQYPEIERYQKLGFKDVWASPAVVCYSVIVPDYTTSFRGIRGFLKAGQERAIGGAMTTTWEWMSGAVVSNSLLGMVYSAECAWFPGAGSVADYARRYAQRIHGIDDPTGELTLNALATPFPRKGPGAWISDNYQSTRLFWADATDLRRRWSRRQPRLAAEAEPAAQLAADAVARVDAYAAKATRNQDLFAYAKLAYRLLENGPRRLAALEGAAKHYNAALKPGADAAAELTAAGASVKATADALSGLHDDYDEAVLQLGAAESDLNGIARLAGSYGKLAQQLDELAAARRNDPNAALPAPETLGLELGKATLVGHWEPKQLHNEDVAELRFDLPAGVWQGGPLRIEWFYTGGAHALRIDSTQLLKGDQPVAEDQHAGITGAGHGNNLYTLNVAEVDPAAKYTLVGRVHAWGGGDSAGEVWLLTGE